MPVQFTTRRKNRYPQAGDVPVVHTDIQHLAEDLDDAPTYDQGVILSRPTSTAPSPGEVGRWYRSTNQGPGNQGLLYLDTGTSWDNVAKYAHIADTYANRPAASADLNGLRFWATDKWMEWQCIASAWVLLRAEAQPLAAPPTDANSVDGQRISLPLGSARAVFRYDAAGGTYRWKCEGPTPVIGFVSTSGTVTNAAYVDLSTGGVGPTITIPWVGQWIFQVGASMAAAASGQLVNMAYSGGGISAADDDSAEQGSQSTAGTGMFYNTVSRPAEKVVTPAASVITAKYKSPTGSASFRRRWIHAIPQMITGN